MLKMVMGYSEKATYHPWYLSIITVSKISLILLIEKNAFRKLNKGKRGLLL
jgi:hypothetical protein